MLQNEILNYLESIQGKVAVVVETLDGERLVSIKENEIFPSASTIKLAIMLTLFKAAEDGKLSLDDQVSLEGLEKTGGDGVLKELSEHHSFSYRELCTLMIIVSDNMATNILIKTLGMDTINAQISSLGLKDAHLGRFMMDGEAKKRGEDNFITAHEMSQLFHIILSSESYSEASRAEMLDILKRQQVRGRIDRYLPEEMTIAHKTGDLDFLEHDGGIVYLDNGNAYLIIVFTAEMESNEIGRETIARISKLAYDNFTN